MIAIPVHQFQFLGLPNDRDAGVVDHQVELTVLGVRGLDQPGDRVGVADVDIHADGRTGALAGESVGVLLGSDVLEVGQHHVPAPMYQCGPEGQSDAGRAPGDDGDLLHGSHLLSDR